ncbi:MAG: hypothetical protein V1689_00180 [Pseudomonadota bacterium]
MNEKRDFIKVAFLYAGLFCLMTGCVGLKNYGRLDVETGKVSVNELIENWQNYGIYYAGLAVDNPSGVIFDTKTEGRRITSDKWIPVTEKSVVITIVKWLKANINYPPVLWRILGPEGKFFGYLYSYWDNLVIKAIDDKTLWVDDLPLPPFDYGQGGRI